MTEKGTLFRHKKRGAFYTLLHEDALLEATGESVVVYVADKDGQVWVRPKAEFFDGRFEEIF